MGPTSSIARATETSPFAALADWVRSQPSNPHARFEAYLARALSSSGASVSKVVTPFLMQGRAKRLRPWLTIACGSLAAAEPDDALFEVAVAVELVHTASLFHDDVIDGTSQRRGVAALHHTHGRRAAVLVGAHLLNIAGRLIQGLALRSVEVHQRLKTLVAQAATDTCVGQLRELLNTGNLETGEEEYLHIIELKTARLFEASCRAGALVAGGEVEAVGGFGRHFGILFQIADDVRDILGSPEELGRPPGADIRDGTYTLPILTGLNGDGEDSQELLTALEGGSGHMPKEEVHRLLAALARGPGIAVALRRAEQAGAASHEFLDGLPRGGARDVLARTVDELLQHLERLAARVGA